MLTLSNLKRFGAVAVSAALVATMAGCAGGGNGISDTSQGTAATLNGKPIGEKAITEYVAEFRESADLTDDDAWGQWMVSNGYTPESVREEVINFYADKLLLDQAAEEKGIKIEQSEIDDQLSQAKAMFESEDKWKEALEQSGMTEEEYIDEVIRTNLLQQKIQEALTSEEGTGSSDEELLAYLQDSASLLDGTKRSSHILFNSEDRDTAEQVLERINSGELDFAAAAEQYSADTGSAAQGGDVGWDATASFVTGYQNALEGLEKDQVSDLVESDYGIHIIKCTDVYNVPEGGITELGQVPEEIVETVRTNMTASSGTTSFYSWYSDYRDAADLVINPMPEKLPYAIDLSAYQAATPDVTAEDPGATEGSASQGSADAGSAQGADAQGADAGASASGSSASGSGTTSN